MKRATNEVKELVAVYGGEAKLINAAMQVLEKKFSSRRQRDSLASPAAVRSYLRMKMTHLEHEEFWVVYLDAQNRVIPNPEKLFRGTLTQTSVYPREVVKAALAKNAAGVILCHNHPSGVCEPSLQDQALTHSLSESLALVDVRVVDHFIVAPGSLLSFAESGLL